MRNGWMVLWFKAPANINFDIHGIFNRLTLNKLLFFCCFEPLFSRVFLFSPFFLFLFYFLLCIVIFPFDASCIITYSKRQTIYYQMNFFFYFFFIMRWKELKNTKGDVKQFLFFFCHVSCRFQLYLVCLATISIQFIAFELTKQNNIHFSYLYVKITLFFSFFRRNKL